MRIPRVFHQIWVGPKPLPATAERFADSWRRWHPAWKLRLWRDKDVPHLVNQAMYGRTQNWGQRADILRHELLAMYGGVYLDIDFECLKNIEPLIDQAEYFYGDETRATPAQGILGSTPGHPFARWCVKRLPEKFPWNGNILQETGPGFFRRAIQSFVSAFERAPLADPRTGRRAGDWLVSADKPSLLAFMPWVFYPYYLGQQWEPAAHTDAYAAHHWQQTWRC